MMEDIVHRVHYYAELLALCSPHAALIDDADRHKPNQNQISERSERFSERKARKPAPTVNFSDA